MGEIRTENITAGYTKDVPIIQDISLAARQGKITVILGPNGVGKSTLLKTIYGFLHPMAGHVYHRKTKITSSSPEELRHRGIAYIAQHHNVFPYLTVEENLEMGAWIHRKSRETLQRLFHSNYERFPILKVKRRHQAGSLSGGEQRMLEIARSLMIVPDVILIDEPTAGLAPRIASDVYEQIKELNREENQTILMVDQNLQQTLKIADYVYVIDLGRIRTHGEREKFGTDVKQLVKDWLY